MGFDVVVVGSINQDLALVTTRRPRPGETILGKTHRWSPGGKGANQAVAAARLGARTAFIGRIGHDRYGEELLASLRAEGIDVTNLGIEPDTPTGLAVITLDESAENSIVVSPGANSMLTPDHVSECEDILAGAKVVLAQLEIPLATVAATAAAAGGLFCLNPAPARPLPVDLLKRVDVLIPNRGELAALASDDAPDAVEVEEMARSIQGPGAVVVTLGSEGALVVEGDETTFVGPHQVNPVDTTGAGDAFCGALGEALARDVELEDAVRWAARAGALATTKPGAQDAMPTRRELEAIS